MKIDSIRGTISTEKEEYKTVDGEQFYKTTITIDGQEIPLVASGYVLKNKSGKCDVKGLIQQEHSDDTYKFTYFYATSIRVCKSQDAPDKNEVTIGGRVIRCFEPMIIGSALTELLSYRIIWYANKGVNFACIRALGQQARKLSDMHENQIINCKCYMEMYKGKLLFYVIESEYRDTEWKNLRNKATKKKKKKRENK